MLRGRLWFVVIRARRAALRLGEIKLPPSGLKTQDVEMTHIFIGCDKIMGARDAYFGQLSALEITEALAPTLTDQRLSEWRTRSPRGFAFTMPALRGVGSPVEDASSLPASLQGFAAGSFGMLQDTEAVRGAWAETVRRAELLSPKVITVETPLGFMPSETSRRQVAWFARELAPQWRGAVSWKPHGLWEAEEVVTLSRELGLVPITDPFEELEVAPARGGTAYFRLYDRRGTRSRFDEFDMDELLARCSAYQRAIIIFKGRNRFRDARLAYTAWESQRALQGE